MPGLINCHTHLPMSVLRGYADDVELSSWLNDYIFPHEDRMLTPLRRDLREKASQNSLPAGGESA